MKKRSTTRKDPTVLIMNGEVAIPYLETILLISQAMADEQTPDSAMEVLTRLAKPLLVFDQLVVFRKRADGFLEPAFARSIEDKPSKETDLSWGDTLARKSVIDGEKVIKQEDSTVATEARQTLSLPIQVNGKMVGALVVTRYHGPAFTSTDEQMANFLALQAAQLIVRQQLADRLAEMEANRHLTILQNEFIALISHELLTPLGFIKGYATTLLREDVKWDAATQREFLTIIDEESDRLRKIIEDLLDSSRLQAGTLHMSVQPIKIDLLIKDMVLRAQTRNPSMKCVLRIDTPGMRVVGDATRLAQVMDNLFTNAEKYAPESPIHLTVYRSGEAAAITFSDQGPGIPEEYMPRLFERFFRVPGSGGATLRGSGLGLFICKQIIMAHRGSINAESKPGAGTTFHIRLPIYYEGEHL
jgi:signal transduction histidine kinase